MGMDAVVELHNQEFNSMEVAVMKNSFFYTRLLDARDQVCYANVQSWTRSLGDVFTKELLLVPINVDG